MSGQKSRLDWVDGAKGISIILVVMMYSVFNVGQDADGIGLFHYVIGFATPFRMPEFFLISGLFLSQVIDRDWRGIGRIPRSGLGLREDYLRFDAERRFEISVATDEDEGPCIAGRLLRGLGLPTDCDAFGRDCRPEHPLGAPMVSSEGACAAYLRYRGGEES